jgi:hypothetical protein
MCATFNCLFLQINTYSSALSKTVFSELVLVQERKNTYKKTFRTDNKNIFLGGNSQNILGKFVRFFVTLRCFYGVVIHRE